MPKKACKNHAFCRLACYRGSFRAGFFVYTLFSCYKSATTAAWMGSNRGDGPVRALKRLSGGGKPVSGGEKPLGRSRCSPWRCVKSTALSNSRHGFGKLYPCNAIQHGQDPAQFCLDRPTFALAPPMRRQEIKLFSLLTDSLQGLISPLTQEVTQDSRGVRLALAANHFIG